MEYVLSPSTVLCYMFRFLFLFGVFLRNLPVTVQETIAIRSKMPDTLQYEIIGHGWMCLSTAGEKIRGVFKF
jgi:hypothetical protein